MEQIRATFTDGTALYYVVSSQIHYGNVIVKVENKNNTLVVSHKCKWNTIRSDLKCRHVLDAKRLYHAWRWHEPIDQVVYRCEKITLQPEWEIIHDPTSVEAIVTEVNADVAEYY